MTELSRWFSLSYAGFLTLPRVLMEDMPIEWQDKMAALLDEYDNNYPNQPEIGTRVMFTENGKFTKGPQWLCNYRHPNRREINIMRGKNTRDKER